MSRPATRRSRGWRRCRRRRRPAEVAHHRLLDGALEVAEGDRADVGVGDREVAQVEQPDHPGRPLGHPHQPVLEPAHAGAQRREHGVAPASSLPPGARAAADCPKRTRPADDRRAVEAQPVELLRRRALARSCRGRLELRAGAPPCGERRKRASRAWPRAPAARPGARASPTTIRSSSATTSRPSSGTSSTPASPTTSPTPPASRAITGTPKWNASSSGMQKPSCSDRHRKDVGGAVAVGQLARASDSDSKVTAPGASSLGQRAQLAPKSGDSGVPTSTSRASGAGPR